MTGDKFSVRFSPRTHCCPDPKKKRAPGMEARFQGADCTVPLNPGRGIYCSFFFSIFAQVSFNETVRLKTGDPEVESASATK